jgi:hypothetical protein
MTEGTTRTPIREVVKSLPLPGVKPVHLDGIFGRLDDLIAARIAVLEAQETENSQALARFWHYAARELDADLHRSIQKKYLTESAAASGRQRIPNWRGTLSRVKYIDPIAWFESKVRLCWRAGLHRSDPLSILDIGPGPGHFAFVARFYGHDVLGLELPQEVNAGEGQTYLYDDLCELYGAERVAHEIMAGEDLPALGRRFDMMTSWLAAFNVHTWQNEQGDDEFKPWSPEDWAEFIARCKAQWLCPEARMVMTLTRRKLSDESWAYLAACATEADRDTCYLNLTP